MCKEQVSSMNEVESENRLPVTVLTGSLGQENYSSQSYTNKYRTQNEIRCD